MATYPLGIHITSTNEPNDAQQADEEHNLSGY